MATYQTGDVFSFPLLTGEQMAGRILLDVKKQCIQPRLLTPDSPLSFFNGSLLIETYRQTSLEPIREVSSEVLIPGLFTDPRSLESGRWTVTGHRDVDPAEVDFPQALFLAGPDVHFVWGEINLPARLTYADFQRINIAHTIEPSGILGEICLYHLGRSGEIRNPALADVELRNLAHSDLRFSPYKKEVYAALDEDVRGSHYETALRLGHDLARFYPRVQ